MASSPGLPEPGIHPNEGVLFPRLATAVLLLLALVLRQEMGFWQGEGSFRGHQACFFLLSAVQYENHGVAKTLGYPSPAIDGVPLGDDDVAPLADDPATLVYVNHPPTVPLLAWQAIRILGSDRWDRWRQFLRGISEDDVDVHLVLETFQEPFLALHLLGLWAFAWCVRQAFGRRVSLLALAILAVTPVAVRLGASVGYENPSLPFVFLALGFWVRHARDARRRDLILACTALALGTCITWGPLLLVPAIALESALQRRWPLVRRALLALGSAGLVPLLAHLLLARSIGAESSGVLSHALDLLRPLAQDPIGWLRTQGAHALEHIGAPILLVALGGLVLVALRGARTLAKPASAVPAPICVPFVLLAAASLQLAAFARHSQDDQPILQLVLAPATAALGGLLLDGLAGRGRFLRPLAAAAILVLGIALPSIAQAREAREGDSLRGFVDAISTLPLVPEKLGRAIQRDTPVGSLVVIPEPWSRWTLPISLMAWRTVTAAETPAGVEAVRARWPAARRLPAYAVKIWGTNQQAGFDIEGANQRFVEGLPPGAEEQPRGFRTWIWKLP